MAKRDSKTNVSARAADKLAAQTCRYCHGKVDVVMRMPGRRMVRLCCERAAAKAA